MADQFGLFGGTRAGSDGCTEIPLADAEPLRLWRKWRADHEALLGLLTETLPWEQHEIGTPAGRIKAPRLECWLADEAGISYVYSGERYLSHPIGEHPDLAALRELVSEVMGYAFDAVFANLYRTGRDSLGAHADDEEDVLGPAAEIVIASLSLGARRRFVVKHRNTDERIVLELGEGDLLLMGRGVQSAYLHSVPKSSAPTGARINLTFRRLRG